MNEVIKTIFIKERGVKALLLDDGTILIKLFSGGLGKRYTTKDETIKRLNEMRIDGKDKEVEQLFSDADEKFKELLNKKN